MNLEKLQFRFAKTMPEIPHEYVVRTQHNESDYVELFETIVMLGVIETFKGRCYRYWYAGDGYKYWAMTTDIAQSQVINRARVASSSELSTGES